jgi:benzoate/toluate 1,2-dioxygenase reductase subunit
MNVFRAELGDRRWLSETTFEVALTRPSGFSFNPKQRIRVKHGDAERDYSLTSTPTDSVLTLCVRLIENGFFTPFLSRVRPGTQLNFIGPHGYFTYRTRDRQAVFIATGTGIAPFVSMARSGIRGFVFLHGVPNEKELHYVDLWREAAALYVPCVSDPDRSSDLPSNAFEGRVSGVIDDVLTRDMYDFYLSGNGRMIREMTHRIDESCPGSRVYTETFYG